MAERPWEASGEAFRQKGIKIRNTWKDLDKDLPKAVFILDW